MTITAWVLLVFVVLLVLFDLWAAVVWGHHATVSYNVLYFSHLYPIIPFAAGLIAGHFFWPQNAPFVAVFPKNE